MKTCCSCGEQTLGTTAEGFPFCWDCWKRANRIPKQPLRVRVEEGVAA